MALAQFFCKLAGRAFVPGWNKSVALVVVLAAFFTAANVVYRSNLSLVPYDYTLLPLGIPYAPQFGLNRSGYPGSPPWDPLKYPKNPGTLTVYLTGMDVITVNAGATLAVQFQPNDALLEYGNLKFATEFILGTNSQVYPKDSRDFSFTKLKDAVSIVGLVSYYPFDTYVASFEVYSVYSKDKNDDWPNPFTLNFRSNIKDSWVIEATDVTPKFYQYGFLFKIQLAISRPPMFQVYPVFVTVAFWLIIVCAPLALHHSKPMSS